MLNLYWLLNIQSIKNIIYLVLGVLTASSVEKFNIHKRFTPLLTLTPPYRWHGIIKCFEFVNYNLVDLSPKIVRNISSIF